jgi:2-methylisocitrate lyase-like PEP mutase family enzyme
LLLFFRKEDLPFLLSGVFPMPLSVAARLRRLIAGQTAIPVVGAYDALTARLVEQAGFAAVYVGGYALSATQLGLPDVGLLTMTEMLDSVRRICGAIDTPVIADGDTGYGNHVNTDRLIRELIRAGAAGVHLEDQTFPKRCGHMDGKRIVPVQAMIDKISAAADARSDPDFVIVARTDALAIEGFEAALDRAARFAEAGADVLFVEAPVSHEQIAAIPRRLAAPSWFNASWDGKSPLPNLEDLNRMGYRLVVYPDTVFAATRAVMRLLESIRKDGSYGDPEALIGFAAFNALAGLARVAALDDRYTTPEGSQP